MGFELTSADRTKLRGVHPDLVRVIERAATLSELRFRVLEGLRTAARQKQLVAKGASKTMNSRHIRASNNFGHAVDIAPIDDAGKVSWDWPLYHRLAKAVKEAARAEGVPIEWGGDWRRFPDGPHWQLPWKNYPAGAPEVAGDAPMTDRRRDQLARSRTMGGLGLAGFGVAADLSNAADHISMGYIAGYVAGALVLIGIAIAAYARWDDAGRPLPRWLKRWF